MEANPYLEGTRGIMKRAYKIIVSDEKGHLSVEGGNLEIGEARNSAAYPLFVGMSDSTGTLELEDLALGVTKALIADFQSLGSRGWKR